MDNFTETSTGVLLIANGFDPVLRWDGQTAQAELAGLAPPTGTPAMTASGTGSIVGNYFAYVRFVDRLGFYSNLSPVSAQLTAQAAGTSGTITDATFAAPIQVTTAAPHGLATGTIVKVTGVGGNTSTNGTWTITVVDASNFTLNGSSGNAAYTGAGAYITGVSTVNYSGIQSPTDSKVVRRQILRNTDGQANTFYVDVDTTNLSSTTFSSTKTDTFLAAGEVQAILDSAGLPLANLRYVPPSHKTTLASHLDRLFLAGQYDETRGAAIVTAGSATVTGVGTDWVAGLVRRQLYVVGANNSYQIASVDVLNQQLTLTEAYADVTDNFALYAIRAQPAERRLVYYTPSSQPESWPPTYALQVQEDDDEITSLMARGSFLYVIERRHIYKLTFQDDPARDGAIFLSANRGCINNRCHVLVDNDAYMLDEYGVHKFDSNGQVQPLSENIQEIFRPGSQYKFAINWRASRWFHAVVYRPQETIRWFVALEGDYLPRNALCYNYRLQRWWIERYPFLVGGACAGHINSVPYAFLAGESAKAYAMWTNTTDVADPALGTVRGNVTSSGLVTLTDSTAAFSTSGPGSVLNAPVVITDKDGKGQIRRVVAATSTQLTVDMPWTTSLSTASVYQVGGVVWNWKSTWLRLNVADTMQERTVEILFDPTVQPATMDVRTRGDFGAVDVQKQSYTSKQGGGVRTDAGLPDKVVDLTKANAVVMIRMPGQRERFIDGRRYTQIELAGATNQDIVAVFELVLEGMANVATISQGG